MPEYVSPEGVSLPVECCEGTFVPAIRSTVSCPTEGDYQYRCTPCTVAIGLSGVAGINGDPDKAADDNEVSTRVPLEDPVEVPGTMTQELGVKQLDKADFEGLCSEWFPIKCAVEPDDLAAKDVLRDFVKVLDGGVTEHDAAINADDVNLPLSADRKRLSSQATQPNALSGLRFIWNV